MIGVYDYTVILTYLSMLSGLTGIGLALGGGRLYAAMFCLLFSGLCDGFDGKVARLKKNRTDTEKRFGIQIDSLADLIAFGALPACLGLAMLRDSAGLSGLGTLPRLLLSAIPLLFALAALVRLAWFNVLEEERQKTEGGANKVYIGLPVTSASQIFPTVLLIQLITKTDLTLVYIGALLVTAFAFVYRWEVKKPGKKGIWAMLIFGFIEAVLLFVFKLAR